MNEFKVGVMALATMAMVAYMSLKVTSNQSGFGKYVTYRTIVSDASGIFPKTPIKVAGINAGRIKKIELQGNQALITFQILEKVEISKDSKLKVKAVGFLGDKHIEILIGNSSERLGEMGFLMAEEGAGVEKLVKDISDVMNDVKIIVGSLKISLAPEGQRSPISKILDDVKSITKTLKSVITSNEERLNNLVKNFEKLSNQLAYHTDESEDNSSMGKIQDILDNTEQLTADISDMIRDVKKGKGTIGKFLVEEEIADEVRETLASVKRLVGKGAAIRTEVSVFTGANTVSGGESKAHLVIYPSPERFYRLGVVTSDYGVTSEREVEKVIDGVKSTETTKTRIKNRWRFDAQLGRVIHNWTFRGGIIESTGGLGLDYSLFSGASRISLEVFDVRTDLGPNLRLLSEFQLWNVFYGTIALDDMGEETRNAIFQVGIKFNDEDLKGLVGFFL